MEEMVNTSALESLQLFSFSDQKTAKHTNLLRDYHSFTDNSSGRHMQTLKRDFLSENESVLWG